MMRRLIIVTLLALATLSRPALADVTELRQLNLTGTQVTNLESLKGLTALRTPYLFRTQVTDLEALKGLTVLRELTLSGTQVPDAEVNRLQQYRQQNGPPSIQVIRG